ncbi:MAG TPA: hypothetical protein VGM98_18605 [Schlesneria sp.]|jgi:hypothetical protein
MDVNTRLPKIAEKLTRKAKANRLSSADLLTECPWLCRQISADAATRGLFDLWSLSSNFDELANVAIVEPAVLAAIGDSAHMPLKDSIVHAGLQHTYGYLLSTIETPYGYKRDRWVSPFLEQAFGLPSDALGPNPAEGTLLANATLIAGMAAFRGDDTATKRLRRVAPAASKPVRKLDLTQFEQTRIIESLSLRDSAGRFRSLRIRTDLVPFPCPVEGTDDTALLIYSVADSRQSGAQLVTVFPVGLPMVADLTHRDRFGPNVEIRTRFNAFVPGVSGQTLIGRRVLQQLQRS